MLDGQVAEVRSIRTTTSLSARRDGEFEDTNLIPGEEEETKLHKFFIQIEEAKRMGIINSK